MKKILGLFTICMLVALSAAMGPPQSGHDLFQKALVKERAEWGIRQLI